MNVTNWYEAGDILKDFFFEINELGAQTAGLRVNGFKQLMLCKLPAAQSKSEMIDLNRTCNICLPGRL